MVLVADAVLARAVSLWSTLFQTIMAASVRLGRGTRHASAYGCSWKNFLSFALAWLALGIWCIISVVLVLAVTDTGVWVFASECGKLDFLGDVCFPGCNAWFDSGYSLCKYFGFGTNSIRF